MENLAKYVKENCCGTTCDKTGLVEKIVELEVRNKGLQKDLNGLDDIAANFDERVNKKARLAFEAGVKAASGEFIEDITIERQWLQFKAEQGL